MKTISISKTTLLKLYYEMLKIRKFQLKVEAEYHKDEMKTPLHLCIGQEAAAAGVCMNLKKTDYVFSSHRGHGHFLAKGGSLKKLAAELHCKETGCSRGRGGSMHLIAAEVSHMGSSAIVGGSIPIATGAALSSVLKKDGRVSVVFFGDAATEEGVFFESMNFAALKKLPVVYVCENNFYSVCSHQSAREANLDISMRAKAFDIPSYQIDASDVCQVYLKSKQAIDYAREGRGPVLLECRAYRFRAHAGAGDSHRDAYRKPDEWKEWIKKDPVKNLKNRLVREKILTKVKIDKVTKAIDKEIKEAFKFAQESPLPDKKDLEKYLFS